MILPRSWLAGTLAPFLVGAAAASAGEVAGALLLYSGTGMVRALTLILATELAALAFGFWSAPAPAIAGEASRDRVLLAATRRRWIFALVAFSAGAGFAAAWPLVIREGPTAVGQALGLTVLAGLPLYATGAVLGSVARRRGTVAAPAALGGSAGVLATGWGLMGGLGAGTVLLLGLAAVAAAGFLEAGEKEGGAFP